MGVHLVGTQASLCNSDKSDDSAKSTSKTQIGQSARSGVTKGGRFALFIRLFIKLAVVELEVHKNFEDLTSWLTFSVIAFLVIVE